MKLLRQAAPPRVACFMALEGTDTGEINLVDPINVFFELTIRET